MDYKIKQKTEDFDGISLTSSEVVPNEYASQHSESVPKYSALKHLLLAAAVYAAGVGVAIVNDAYGNVSPNANDFGKKGVEQFIEYAQKMPEFKPSHIEEMRRECEEGVTYLDAIVSQEMDSETTPLDVYYK